MILPISLILTKFICSFVLGITTFSLAILSEFNKDIILSEIETILRKELSQIQIY